MLDIIIQSLTINIFQIYIYLGYLFSEIFCELLSKFISKILLAKFACYTFSSGIMMLNLGPTSIENNDNSSMNEIHEQNIKTFSIIHVTHQSRLKRKWYLRRLPFILGIVTETCTIIKTTCSKVSKHLCLLQYVFNPSYSSAICYYDFHRHIFKVQISYGAV